MPALGPIESRYLVTFLLFLVYLGFCIELIRMKKSAEFGQIEPFEARLDFVKTAISNVAFLFLILVFYAGSLVNQQIDDNLDFLFSFFLFGLIITGIVSVTVFFRVYAQIRLKEKKKHIETIEHLKALDVEVKKKPADITFFTALLFSLITFLLSLFFFHRSD